MFEKQSLESCWGFLRSFMQISFLHYRVPEEKSHMVLPEIEEEYEKDDGKKLSLTSLLLGKSIIFCDFISKFVGCMHFRAPG